MQSILRPVLLGIAVLLAGSIPWMILAGINLKVSPAIPWSAAVMGAYLFFYWRFLQATPARRAHLRANAVPVRGWIWCLAAFVFGFIAINEIKCVFNTLLSVPPSPIPDIAKLPVASLLVYLVMVALVAAVTEEASFRGFMQGPIERTHGPFTAILITGIVFWGCHVGSFAGQFRYFFLYVWYFLATSALVGVMAWLTNSILPSLAAHAAGDFVYTLLSIWAFTRGVNIEKTAFGSPAFYAAVAIPFAAIPLTIWAFRQVSRKRENPVLAA